MADKPRSEVLLEVFDGVGKTANLVVDGVNWTKAKSIQTIEVEVKRNEVEVVVRLRPDKLTVKGAGKVSIFGNEMSRIEERPGSVDFELAAPALKPDRGCGCSACTRLRMGSDAGEASSGCTCSVCREILIRTKQTDLGKVKYLARFPSGQVLYGTDPELKAGLADGDEVELLERVLSADSLHTLQPGYRAKVASVWESESGVYVDLDFHQNPTGKGNTFLGTMYGVPVAAVRKVGG